MEQKSSLAVIPDDVGKGSQADIWTDTCRLSQSRTEKTAIGQKSYASEIQNNVL